MTITNVMGEKRINLAYPIQGKEVAIVSMFSNNIQYWKREPAKILLITSKQKQLLEGVFTDRGLSASIGRKLITNLLDANDNIVKMDKSAHVMGVVISLDELDNTDNLEDRRLSNILLRYHVTAGF